MQSNLEKLRKTSQTVHVECLILFIRLETSNKVPEKMQSCLQQKVINILSEAKTELLGIKWKCADKKKTLIVKVSFTLDSDLSSISRQVKFQSNFLAQRFGVTQRQEKFWDKMEIVTSQV